MNEAAMIQHVWDRQEVEQLIYRLTRSFVNEAAMIQHVWDRQEVEQLIYRLTRQRGRARSTAWTPIS